MSTRFGATSVPLQMFSGGSVIDTVASSSGRKADEVPAQARFADTEMVPAFHVQA